MPCALITKGFDLTNLPEANYYFELDAGNEISIIPFSVSLDDSGLMQVIKSGDTKTQYYHHLHRRPGLW